jgi:hypothetical protein
VRVCSRCKLEKPIDAFGWIKTTGKYHSGCKACMAEARRTDRAARGEHYRAVDKACRDRTRQAVRQRNRKAHWENRDERLAAIRARQSNNRDRYNASRVARRAGDPEIRERRNQATRDWWDRNREQVSATRKAAWRDAAPDVKFRRKFSASLSKSLKRGDKRGRKSERLLGYTYTTLRAHLERQFTKGMTWANYGMWHVDHIVPLSSFAPKSADDPAFRLCWALTNLRPLWARDNLAKHAKRTHLL